MPVQTIAVAPSVRLAAAVCAAHLAATGLVWLVPIPALGKGVVTLAIAFSLIYFLARDATLHAASAIVALELNDGGGIAFRTRDGTWVESELSGSSYVSPALTIVVLQPRGRGRTRRAIILPDSVDARDFRRLRIWMRWKHGGVEPSALAEC
ncbi:MAG TPA: protein YgfX [Burkholderiales bacterium]|nr:protein YgfX [Burkholderiales bacterium]